MRRLQRMADLGVDIGERLQQQAELASTYADSEAVPDNLPHSRRLDEIARAFAQVSRAVGVLTALEDRIDNGLPALPFEDRARRERHAADKRAAATRAVLHDADDILGPLSPRRAVALRLSLDRLLDRELSDLDRFLDRPFDEIVARVRRDLGLGEEDEGDAQAFPPPDRGSDLGEGVMSDGSRSEPYAIAKDLAIAAKNASAKLRLGEAVEGASAATLLENRPRKTSKPQSAGPLHRHSAVPLPHAVGKGEERSRPPP